MIPYFHNPTTELFGFSVDTYFLSIGIALVLGSCVGFPMAKRLGLKRKLLAELYLTGLASGLLISHWVSVLLYFPETVLENPWVLLDVFNGLSSVGGFVGAFIGVWLMTRGTKIPVLRYLDILCYGLSFGLIFGRLGCFLIHDHQGLPTAFLGDFLLAVDFPEGPAFDLGLSELIILLPLVLFQTLYLLRRPRPGRVIGWTMLYYGLIRFHFDFLRVYPGDHPLIIGDARYFGLTAAQYICVGFVVGGLIMMRRLQPGQDRHGPEPAPAPEAAADPPADAPAPAAE